MFAQEVDGYFHWKRAALMSHLVEWSTVVCRGYAERGKRDILLGDTLCYSCIKLKLLIAVLYF
jgi:hypothetical protein